MKMRWNKKNYKEALFFMKIKWNYMGN